MGNADSVLSASTLGALGMNHCSQSLYSCDGIGKDNIPAYSLRAPKGGGKSASGEAVAMGHCLQYCIPIQNSLGILPPTTTYLHAHNTHTPRHTFAADPPPYIPTAITSTLKAHIGYCCAADVKEPISATAAAADVKEPTDIGYNNFQGSIHETIPGMANVDIWKYEHGGPTFLRAGSWPWGVRPVLHCCVISACLQQPDVLTAKHLRVHPRSPSALASVLDEADKLGRALPPGLAWGDSSQRRRLV
eukprot:CAMPEP_0179869334 /NCGR_PEP_ID=MMETSP0982-20121206/19458_1 /TAXON_ID=483367 /ORGANISM="non described non described, Strain CCMP 2436" /LENGTH=246 /DNA_ID=CAMNT_0021759373 /DNA_START=95 /DNA_END=834 /DNA_ORIENTATION=+